HAGYDPDHWQGRVGVFSGTALNTYFTNVGLNRRLAEEYIPTLIGNDKDFLSTRISYKLNLKGPSITVQTACSTSMVAVHLARQSLLSEEIDMALAGAVSVRVPHRAGYFCDGGGVVSPDGHVRAFDAEAQGSRTPVADPIEVRALTKAFRTFTQRSGYCAIGSVKTNVRHLGAAAASTGIIKTVLALQHRQRPPSLHFTEDNPGTGFART